MKLTLCGSRKFEAQFHEWSEKLAYAGHVVYGLAVYNTRPDPNDEAPSKLTVEQKTILDQVHMAKIDNSDGIVVINVGGYIGESTKNEIRWAKMKNKEIYWLEHSGLSMALASELL
jgi:hypothetical protein